MAGGVWKLGSTKLQPLGNNNFIVEFKPSNEAEHIK